ncbi:MAG: hypothetical protein FJY88_11530 [Candidatus Eisenbacteria bacterium]|nr:hypothetical protein [Candidatus Eisenbacteria bacterium]
MREKFPVVMCLIVLLSLVSQPGCGDDKGTNADSPPVLSTLVIAGGSPYTLSRTVTLAVSASDDKGVSEILIAENPSFTGAAWRGYAAQIQFELSSGDGSKTVHAKVRDTGGNESSKLSGTIVLAESAPVAGLSPHSSARSSAQGSPASTTLELWIANAVDMYSGVFKLSFDPDLVEVTDIEISEIAGHVLKETGATLYVANDDYDNEAGEVLLAVLPIQDGFAGVPGSGPFARITFLPRGTLASPATVEFVEGEWSRIYRYREDGPPEAMDGVVLIDGWIEP